ncbi:cell death abnormality protein 1 [Biomphalaria pfeifferi]|uniref:Cell death abnormality protein 1 n=1 Tax=Biomphalaria pfeifferi TaxID=112525 RepID=A0AAD8C2S0_BIOPF|nr:cell death abnormality protein 1 [Biomphalaria pfeifferi]
MNSDIYMGLSRQIFLFLLCVLVTTKACTLGWFGSKCQFMCHCSAFGICDDTGRCLTKCDNGWFGQSCQYQDLATIPGATITAVPQQKTLTWLTDRDETTCNQSANLTTIQISWDTSFPFTWLRLNINSPALTTIFTVTLKTTNHLDISCNKLAITIVDSTTVDLRCDMGLNETVTQIILTGPGVKSICSLYINGGRNVALHQSAEQTSTYTENSKSFFASLAVDGNTNCYFYNNGSTTHTDSEPSPSWTLTLDTPRIVNRFVIYNRADSALIRLKNFNLTAFDINNKALWSYQDQNPEKSLIYTFTRFESDPVSKIRIVPKSKESYDTQYILTLCEVFMYGDCVPGNWGLECNNTCPVECPGSCHQGTGTCFICQGRSDPPLCNTACPDGQWGPNCTNQCSISCYDGSCDRITGQCDKGCNGFINPPFCNTGAALPGLVAPDSAAGAMDTSKDNQNVTPLSCPQCTAQVSTSTTPRIRAVFSLDPVRTPIPPCNSPTPGTEEGPTFLGGCFSLKKFN